MGQRSLSVIYTNSFKANCYECWIMGRLGTRVEPGWVRVARTHNLRTRMQLCSRYH